MSSSAVCGKEYQQQQFDAEPLQQIRAAFAVDTLTFERADDICEKVLTGKMAALECGEIALLQQQQQQEHVGNANATENENEAKAETETDAATAADAVEEEQPPALPPPPPPPPDCQSNSQLNGGGDGSDSGVEVANSAMMGLQRALSSNSGGMDEATHGLNMSCDSSMISCGSDVCEPKMMSTATVGVSVGLGRVSGAGCASRSDSGSGSGCGSGSNNSYECCSENGSESSSIAGAGAGAATKPLAMPGSRKMSATVAATTAATANHLKKKVAMLEPDKSKERENLMTASAIDASSMGVGHVRPRLSTLKRTASLPRASHVGGTAGPQGRFQAQANGSPASGARSVQASRGPRPQKPDSLPTALSRTHSSSMQRLVQRTPSLSRARTPATPSDDGRWPSVPSSRLSVSSTASTASGASGIRRGHSVTPDMAALKKRTAVLQGSGAGAGAGSGSGYGTLPRRRKQKSVEDLVGATGGLTLRSSSITRESRDARMSSSMVLSSRKNLMGSYGPAGRSVGGGKLQQQQQQQQPQQPQPHAASRAACKTRIYHETSAQTALTGDDMAKLLAGERGAARRPIDAAEQRDQQTQSDLDVRDREIERLNNELRQLMQREHERNIKLQREREEKLAMQRELHLNTERIMAMLEIARVTGPTSCSPISHISHDDGGSHDSLLMLESQIQMSGNELLERQHEICQLRQLCHSLQSEMQRSLSVQECLLQEKAAIEQESSELHDFLQHEKTAMCDALKEMETEYQLCKQQLINRDEEVKVLRDECRHLVRLNEQRRQENRLLQTKYSAIEVKCKELIAQQNASNSSATLALSGLHTRLDNLVEQLVSTYNISEQDLEDIAFQNENTSSGISGGCGTISGGLEVHHPLKQASPNCLDLPLNTQYNPMEATTSDASLSPQRNQSFIAAVISAIRHATTSSNKKPSSSRSVRQGNTAHRQHQQQQHYHHHNMTVSSSNNSQLNDDEVACPSDSDSTEMLDSETEPCLMMDNVLEDVTMPDSHSHNLVSSCTGIISQIEIPYDLASGEDSLHNLSQAIANRQQAELQIKGMNGQKMNQPREHKLSEESAVHDSVAEMPSIIEYSSSQIVVDQAIEVDSLVTKLLKVLRLIQMENDNCIQQLVLDKNKLQETKEDMLEKLKDLEDVNIKLQDELMDATQELMVKSNDLSNTKADMQRHRKEIDRLNEDICNLSTLCSNYRKLSPTVEFPPHGMVNGMADYNVDEVPHILGLLRMWQHQGQLNDERIRAYLCGLWSIENDNRERLHIYANQLESILDVLGTGDRLAGNNAQFRQLLEDIRVMKLNADWTNLMGSHVNVENVADAAICNSNIATASATTTSTPATTGSHIDMDIDINANEPHVDSNSTQHVL